MSATIELVGLLYTVFLLEKSRKKRVTEVFRISWGTVKMEKILEKRTGTCLYPFPSLPPTSWTSFPTGTPTRCTRLYWGEDTLGLRTTFRFWGPSTNRTRRKRSPSTLKAEMSKGGFWRGSFRPSSRRAVLYSTWTRRWGLISSRTLLQPSLVKVSSDLHCNTPTKGILLRNDSKTLNVVLLFLWVVRWVIATRPPSSSTPLCRDWIGTVSCTSVLGLDQK